MLTNSDTSKPRTRAAPPLPVLATRRAFVVKPSPSSVSLLRTRPSRRHLELAAILIATGLTLFNAYAVHLAWTPPTAWLILLAIALGLCAADLVSGIVHWAADTYGSPTMPVFGAFVRTFREHHADPEAITRHDFIEANGDVCIFSAPVHVVLLYSVESPWLVGGLFGLFCGSYANSQLHKWAHSVKPPRSVQLLQRLRLVLSPALHRRHHSGAHRTHYCITSGWMNGILDRTRFFRGIERLLTGLLGPHAGARAAHDGAK